MLVSAINALEDSGGRGGTCFSGKERWLCLYPPQLYECRDEGKVYKESMQYEIRAEKRVGTVEQMDANMVAMEKDIKEILRINEEQKRLWEAYEGR